MHLFANSDTRFCEHEHSA